MSTIIRFRTALAGITLVVVGLSSTPAQAQCPDNIPQSVINSIQHPEVRAQAAKSPQLTAAFIAQNGGLATMIQQVRAQINSDKAWIAEEEANQRTLGQQGMGNIDRARAGRDLLQRQRESVRLSQAYLQVLECHAGRGGATSSAPSTGDRSGRGQGDATEDAIRDRNQMVDKVVNAWKPPTGYATGLPGASAGVALDDPFATPVADECRPSMTFRNLQLSADGAAIDYELSATHSAGKACTVSFGIEMRAGTQIVRLPSRTMVIPAAGINLTESVRLPVPVEVTTRACTGAEPARRAFLERRDQLTARYTKIQSLAADTLNNRSKLERSVTMRDVGNAVLGVGLALDALKLGLTTVQPAAGRALGLGGAVGVELVTYVGKTVAACDGTNNDHCMNTIATDGAVWVEKTLAAAFEETFSGVDKLTDVILIAKQASDLRESMAARSKTLDVLSELDASLTTAVRKLDRIREDRAYIDEVVKQLEGLCRSPVIHLTAVDVKPLAASGK